MPIFIDPTTDFGFKKVFGEEKSEGVLSTTVSVMRKGQPRLRSFGIWGKLPESK
ncbi:hypothetical protein HYR99_03135 [Candidatus Poribacteria bacterium]|nr:hypothetical protein [Candidatus Poribacteria bacterium]